MSAVAEPSGLVAVVAVGAVGGTVAGGLLAAGHEITLVDSWFENVETIRRNGLSLTRDGERATFRAVAIYPDELERLGQKLVVVFLSCKSYETAQTVRALLPYLADDAVVVSVQNGINEDVIAAIVGKGRTIGCVVHYNCAMPEAGHAVRFSPGAWHSFTLGELEGGQTRRLAQVTKLFSSIGQTSVSDDIFADLWGKLGINCMLNGLTAVSGWGTAQLWGSRQGGEIMIRLAREAAEVAKRQGRAMAPIHLNGTNADIPAELLLMSDEPNTQTELRRRLSAEGEARAKASARGQQMVSSMLQDMTKHRRPEIDYLNGYVARHGAILGVNTPANDAVVAAVHAVASGDEYQDGSQISRIAESLGIETA